MSLPKVIAGNWKMNGSNILIEKFSKKFRTVDLSTKVEVIVFPPFTHLKYAYEQLKDTNIKIGAQDCHHESTGAFTGNVSSKMLAECGASFVIIGHSERRELSRSENKYIPGKISSAVERNLTPIVCIGESLIEHQNNQTNEILEKQLKFSLKQSIKSEALVVAYEPKWAIGTGKMPSLNQINQTHRCIREILSKIFDKESAKKIRIIYGGSVNPSNASEILNQEEVSGVLVGGASISTDDFLKIVTRSY